VEEELRACVKRETQLRERAEASDAFKEVFLSMLGHDLRNPLNTVLTTARLMKARRELLDDSERRIDRIVASGVRMQRMIDQLLDVARARLAGGIPVTPLRQDIVPLVSKIVEEVRAAHPGRLITARTAQGCTAMVDGDRFEQVVSNLLGNAVAHGDADFPITVTVAEEQGAATVSVHNFGNPIDPSLVPTLFDPFRRGDEGQPNPDGLGLGLYIVDRIMSAHGGTVTVESAADLGTRFDVTFPLGPHE
jgi:signal transduction histidine kinase